MGAAGGPQIMFIDPTLPFADENSCKTCRWNHTDMCPLHYYYIGRPMGDITHIDNICHRFLPSIAVEKNRQERIMTKLHENLF
jgi:hypothetical protein